MYGAAIKKPFVEFLVERFLPDFFADEGVGDEDKCTLPTQILYLMDMLHQQYSEILLIPTYERKDFVRALIKRDKKQ